MQDLPFLKPLQIGNLTIAQPTLMAPMCGISDSPWRRLVRRFKVGMVYSEMTSSEALIRNIERSYQLLAYEAEECPLAMQLCGSEAAVLAEAARKVEGLGAALVDLNMGCPVKKITSQGAGSALLLDLPKVAQIIRAMVQAVKIPVTIKIRSGWDERRLMAHEIAHIAENEGACAITIHARTRSQGFEGHADWRIIHDLVAATRLPVIGNGDVLSPEDVHRMLRETGCAGVMIGRGAQGRPWIFQQVLDPEFEPSMSEKHFFIRQHFEDACAFYGPRQGLLMMRKHLGWYSKKLRNGSHFRERIMKTHEPQEVFQAIDSFFLGEAAEANSHAA